MDREIEIMNQILEIVDWYECGLITASEAFLRISNIVLIATAE